MTLSRRTCLQGAGALVAATATPVLASGNPRSKVRLAGPGHVPPPATLKDVEWLVGSWSGDMPEGPVEIVFMPPRFQHLPGFVRAVNRDGIIFYEIITIVETGGSLAIRVKHFTPQLAGWEAQDAYLERPLIAMSADTLWFHRCTYVRTGSDSHTVYFLNMEDDREQDTLVIPFRRG